MQDPLVVDVVGASGISSAPVAENAKVMVANAAGVPSNLKGLHGGVVHVQSWAQIPKCLVLRLTHSRVQAVFRDGSLLLIHQRKNLAAYRAPLCAMAAGNALVGSSAGEFAVLPLDKVVEHPEVLQRLRQVKALQLNL